MVAPTRARFVVPLPERATWEWCLPETRALGLEYRWTVEVQNQNETYDFGYTLFNCQHHGPTSGDVRALLEAGQMNVWKAAPTGLSLVNDAHVRVDAVGNRLVIAVDDPKTLRLLFSDQPMRATFIVQLGGEDVVRQDAPISYSQP